MVVNHANASPTAPDASDNSASHGHPPSDAEAANPKPGSGFGGWVRVDADHVLRGWVTDRNDRALRPMVEVLIDDEPIALRAADRFDQKLVELGEEDGRYAFAVIIPEAYRDGQPHNFEARVQGDLFHLKSKRSDFLIDPSARVPHIDIYRHELGRAVGRVVGGQVSKSAALEIWRDGQRLNDGVVTEWIDSSDEMTFAVTYPLDVLSTAADAPAPVLAVAGMIEAGLPGAPMTLNLEASGHISAEGVLTLSVHGAGDLTGRAIEMRAMDSEGSVLGTQPIKIVDEHAQVTLPAEANRSGLTIALSVDGWSPSSLHFHPRRVIGNLTANASFMAWSGEAPAHWKTDADDDVVVRGFQAFPARVIEQQGISGDFAHVELRDVTAGAERVVLRQSLSRSISPQEPIPAAVLMRASERISLRLRLTDIEGVEIAGFGVDSLRPWVWDFGASELTVPADAAAVALEIVAISSQDLSSLMIDVAGARIGGDSFIDEAAEPINRATQSDNAVINADLGEWPNGVVVRDVTGRSEVAKGWFVVNRRSSSPISARAFFSPDEMDTVGIAVAAPVVPDHCRLEIQLNAEILEGITTGLVSFEAGTPLVARGLMAASPVPVPEFLLIDRVMVLRRQTVATERGFQISDITVATVGRRLLVTRDLHRFDLPMSVPPPAVGSDFAWEQRGAEADPAEYFLAIEFRQPFAVALRNVSVTLGGREAAEDEPYLMLEDRSIAAQAEHIKGLASWISPHVATPLSRPDGLDGARPPMRWRWGLSAVGTVEVVICVYNAVEETLDCLRSLMTSTTVPHMVRIIDDASEPIVGQRLDAFVADKPWMQVVHHAENQGYTTSADEGIRGSSADWVVLLNSDTVVTPGWLEGLLEAAASGEDVAMVGPLSNAATFQSVPDLYDGRNQFKTNTLPPGWTASDVANVVARASEKAFPDAPLLNGFCTLIRRSVFLEVGGLNRVAFPTGYGEENDLCTRVTKAGYRLVLADHVYVYHSKSASFGSARRTELAKAGSKALKELHPDVDFGALTVRFRDIPALVRLRAAVRETYEEHI